MINRPILVICDQAGLAELIARDLGPRSGLSVMNVKGVDLAIDLMDRVEPSLVVFHLTDRHAREHLDRLLWSFSQSFRPLPVVAIGEHYDEAEALTLFQMGVTDYLSLSDHRDNLPRVIRSLVSTRAQGHGRVVDDFVTPWNGADRPRAVSQLS